MRLTARTVIPLLVAVVLIVGYILLKPSDAERSDSIASAPAPETHDAEPEPEEPKGTEAPGETPAGVGDFVQAYAADGPDAQWLAALEEATAPGLFASLATSDRELAEGATTILEADETHAVVGDGQQRVYTVHYRQLDSGHEHDGEESESTVTVTGIDYIQPSVGAALPLGPDSMEQLREPVQTALTAVVAQPGGQSDKGRRELLREVFQDPQEAVAVPRVAPEGQVVRIGNAHELVPAAEGEALVVYATVPYQLEGEEAAEWVTVTVELARDDAGRWVPHDAHM